MTDMHSIVAHVVGLALAYGVGWVMGFNTGRNGRSRPRRASIGTLQHEKKARDYKRATGEDF